MRRATLSALILLGAVVIIKLSASVIPPPDLTVPCDGFQMDAHCVPGTIVRFSNGWPVTEMLKPSIDAAPVDIPYLAPVRDYPTPVSDVSAVTPEPSYLIPILAVLALISLWKWVMKPEIGGGK